jgi:hypothetical protein
MNASHGPNDPPPEDPPIATLGPDATLLSVLERAGLTTIGRAEAAIAQDPQLGNVLGLGTKRVAWLKGAIAAYRGNSTTAAKPPPADDKTSDTLARPVRRQKKTADQKELQHKWLWLLAILGFGFMLYLVASQGLPLWLVILFFFSASVVAAGIIFRMFPESSATASGSIEGSSPVGKYKVAAKLGGAIAAGAVYFVLLMGSLWFLGHQSATVYFVFTDENGVTSSTGNGGVDVSYRRPSYGQGVATGHGNSVVIQDLPSWTSIVQINNISVAGYVVKRSTQGEAPPWTFPIKNGEVTIEMQKVQILKDPMPTWKVVRGMLADRQVTTDRVLQPSAYKKREVALTVKNRSDRDIAIVAYDCAAAVRGGPDRVSGTGWADCRDEEIRQDGQCNWPTFDEFENPTGWFAVFVRYLDPITHRERQQPLGVFDLFASQRPVLVIRRDFTQAGIAFEIDTKESQIGK